MFTSVISHIINNFLHYQALRFSICKTARNTADCLHLDYSCQLMTSLSKEPLNMNLCSARSNPELNCGTA